VKHYHRLSRCHRFSLHLSAPPFRAPPRM